MPARSKKSPAKAAARKTAAPKKAIAPKKLAPRKKSTPAAQKKTAAPARAKIATLARGEGLRPSTNGGLQLGTLKPNRGSWPKRTRVGRGHGSGMVKTGGEGGKGQTVRSGGGKGPAFEGGQTPWARRLPHRRGYSQKARDIGHFRTRYAVINLSALASWDASVEVNPQTLKVANIVRSAKDGVKVLGGTREGEQLPQGLVFRDVIFSTSAREALTAAGALFESES